MSDQADSLSEREVEILRLVATGASNKEIASSLVISPNTVKVHLRNIFAKIQVASRTEATLYAIKNGLVAQPDASALELAPELPGLVASPDDIFSTIALASEVDGLPGQGAAFGRISPRAEAEGDAERSPGSRPRTARLPGWILLAGLLVLVLVGAASAYAILGRGQPPASTPVTLQASPVPAPARWSQDTALPEPLFGMGMSLYEGRYYLIAGSDGKSVQNKVYAYNPADKKWLSLADKPTSTSHIRAALLGERIYVPGGKTANGKPSNILEVYDPRHDRWESKQPLPKPLSDYALASFDGKLYLFGGFDGSAYSTDVYIYNPDTDAWKMGSPLPSGRSSISADAVEGKIVICGGYDGKQALSQVLIYYPNRDNNAEPAWENGPDLPQGRYGMNSTSVTNMVYLFGGMSGTPGGGPLQSLVLVMDNDSWAEIDQASAGLGGEGSALTAGNYIHIFGGNLDAPSDQHLVYQAIYTIAIPITTRQ